MVSIPVQKNAPTSTCHEWKSAQFFCEMPIFCEMLGIRRKAPERFNASRKHKNAAHFSWNGFRGRSQAQN
jgi:hypothetical protein